MRARAMRQIWFLGGLVALGLGAIGVILPLVPTVPFLLLAAFCFSRSSRRLHDWLMTHPVFGPPIHDWRERGAISRRAKWLATVSIAAAFGISVAMGVAAPFLLIQMAVLAAVSTFIWTRPEGRAVRRA